MLFRSAGTYEVCVVIYDVHYTVDGDAIVPKTAKELRAGGTDHNTDNSAEKNSSRDPLRYGYQCASATIDFPDPKLSLAKSAVEATYDAVGDTIHYELLVTNTGNVPLAGPVAIDDDLATDEACPALTGIGDNDAELDVGEAVTCTATVTASQGDLDAGSIVNTATASAGGTTSPSDTATVDADPKPALTLEKSATESTYDAVGDVIHYAFLVTNTGNVRIAGPVTIDDDRTTDEACPAVTTVGDEDAWLDVGEAVTCTATHTVISADLEAGELVNIASATASAVTSPTDTVTIEATITAAIGLVKSVEETEFAQVAGQTIHFRFTVTNTGNVRLEGPVTIDDSMTSDEACPSLATVGNEDAWFDPGETIVCTATYVTTEADVAAKHVDNVATASVGPVDSDESTAEVRMAPTLAVLLDTSGSMRSRVRATVRRYNALLAEWQARTDLAPYSLTLFSSLRFTERYLDVTIATVPKMTVKTIGAGGHTPLYDAAAHAIRDLEARHPIGQVVFVISTDGRDNASTTETKASLATLIRHMKRAHGWRFVYDGTHLASLEAAAR